MGFVNKFFILLSFTVSSLIFSSPTNALEPSKIQENNKKSMVFLKLDGVLPDGRKKSKEATGYIIDKSGYILTNYHVLPQDKNGKFDRDELKILGHVVSRYSFGKPVDLIQTNKFLDLALLKFRTVEGMEITPVKCGNPATVKPGDKVVSLGFPLHIDLSTHVGHISTIEHFGGKWLSDVPLNYGDSGGPVFNTKGEWVAIAKGAITGKNIEDIKILIPRNHANNLIDLSNACNGNLPPAMVKLEEIERIQKDQLDNQKKLEEEKQRRLQQISSCKSQAKNITTSCTAYDRSGFHSSPSASCTLTLRAPSKYFFAADEVIVEKESYRQISGASAKNAVKPQYRNVNGKRLVTAFLGRIGCTNSSGTGRTCESKASISQLAYPFSCVTVSGSM